MRSVIVAPAHSAFRDAAAVISQRFGIPLRNQLSEAKDLAVVVTGDGLHLLDAAGTVSTRPFILDFDRVLSQRLYPGQRGPGVLKAVGAPPQCVSRASQSSCSASGNKSDDCSVFLLPGPATPLLVDATAGCGVDSIVLASQGWHVLMLESNPVLACLLEDGLARMRDLQVRSRLSLLHVDSRGWMNEHKGGAHVVYIDMMYDAEAHKSGKSKKHAQFLQALVSPSSMDDRTAMLASALECAQVKVVMKRPKRGEPPMPPSHTCVGNTTLFDVFLPITQHDIPRFLSAHC